MAKPATFKGLHLKRWKENSIPVSWNTFQEPVLGLAGIEVLFFIPVHAELCFGLVTRTVDNTPISWLLLKSTCTASRYWQCIQAALTRGWEGTQLEGNLSCLKHYFTPYNIMLSSKAEGTFSHTAMALAQVCCRWTAAWPSTALFPLLLFFPFTY